jgi:hypothetical protein
MEELLYIVVARFCRRTCNPGAPRAQDPSAALRLLSHIDPGPAEESETYIRLIYAQRRTDLSSERNSKTGR